MIDIVPDTAFVLVAIEENIYGDVISLYYNLTEDLFDDDVFETSDSHEQQPGCHWCDERYSGLLPYEGVLCVF